MSSIYRALYTRCANGVNFHSALNTNDGQKLFSTGGEMGLPSSVLSVLETEIRRDVYGAGIRPYTENVCRFLPVGGMCALIHYRWQTQEETGSREFCIVKALIGTFANHPIEYMSQQFFNGGGFFSGYRDAEGNEITGYRQLLTYKGSAVPPLFKPMTDGELFALTDAFPVMSFDGAGEFVAQSTELSERLRAAVCHLIGQFALPENERKGIIFKGTPEQLRYWFAAIGYAFSAAVAQGISFSIGMPPNGYSYRFATDALAGWDVSDPDIMKAGSAAPSNMVYLEQLPPAGQDEYYDCIASFDRKHRSFISDYMPGTGSGEDTVSAYPARYPAFAERYERESRGRQAETARINQAETHVARDTHAETVAAEEDSVYKLVKYPNRVYNGYMANGKYHGVGTMTWFGEETTFTGLWHSGEQRWGLMEKRATGGWSAGEWLNKKFVRGFIFSPGRELFRFNCIEVPDVPFNGSTENALWYAGEFANNLIQGWGTIEFPDGCYTGQWVAGQPHGWGIYRFFADGRLTAGNWSHGKYTG